MILFHIEKLELIRQATPFCTGKIRTLLNSADNEMSLNSLHVESSGSVCRALDWGSKGCLFEFHCR